MPPYKPSSWSCSPRVPQTYSWKNCPPILPTPLPETAEESPPEALTHPGREDCRTWVFPQVPVILHIRALGRLPKAAQASEA